MPELSHKELRTVLDKLDDVCQQAKGLHRMLRDKMIDRARDQRVRSNGGTKDRKPRQRKP